jgi:hypothetical protein
MYFLFTSFSLSLFSSPRIQHGLPTAQIVMVRLLVIEGAFLIWGKDGGVAA